VTLAVTTTTADFSKYALKEENYVDSNSVDSDSNVNNVKNNKTTKNVIVSSHNCNNNNSFGVIKKV
jgi:3-dehydroquinate dehydratase